MAAGPELASAHVALIVKAPDMRKHIEEAIGKVPAEDQGSKLGSKLAGGMKTALKVGGLAVGAVLGTALAKGFGRLKSIETAQAKLKGLGSTSGEVEIIMGNALASVKGTAFGLDEAATVAASAVAAGIKPGKELESTLKGVANVAAASGRGLEETGNLFTTVAANQAAYTQDIKQLANAGLPIWDKLREVTGATQEEVRTMATEGKIDFETFSEAAALAAGTVADELGNTTSGSFDNMMAALGRLGAKILEDIFPLIGPLFQDITAWLDVAAEKVEPLVDAFGVWLKEAIENVQSVWGWMKDNSAWIGPIAAAVGGAATAFALWVGAIKAWTIVTNVAKGVQLAFNAVMAANPIMLVVLAVAALVAGLVWFFTQTELGQEVWANFTQFLKEAWENISSFFITAWENYIKPVFDGIAAVVMWVWETILQPIFLAFQVGFAILGGILAGIWESIIKPVFDGIGAVFEWVYNNIIVPIILGIQIYVKIWGAIFTWLWNTILKPVFDKIGAIFKWIWNSIIKPIVDLIKIAIDAVGVVFKWLWDNAIKPSFDAISAAFSFLWNDVIKKTWDWISDKIKSGWDIMKGIFDTLVRVVRDDPKKAFEAAKDGIKTAWDKIKDIAKTPVKFVVDTVINDALIGTINKIPGVNLEKVSLPAGFRDGGYTGRLNPAAAAGLVHGDEHVIRSPSRRRIESTHPGLLEHINRTGSLPGYKKGGWVHPMPGAMITTLMHGYPGHMGLDLAMPQGTPIQAMAPGSVRFAGFQAGGYGNRVDLDHGDGVMTRYAHMLAPLHVAMGEFVKAGQVLGLEGSTGMSTGPHLHLEVLKNGRNLDPLPFISGAGSVTPLFGIIDGLMDSLIGKVTDRFPDAGMFVEAGLGVMKGGVEQVIDWAKEKLSIGGPTLFDNGGWLDPGTHLVQNRTRRPEPILTGSQWDSLKSGGRGDVYVQNPFTGEYLLAQVDGRVDGKLAPLGAGASVSRRGSF